MKVRTLSIESSDVGTVLRRSPQSIYALKGRIVDNDFIREWSESEWRIKAYLLRRLRDEHAADEVLQLTSIRCWRGYRSFQRRCTFLVWCLGIARNELNRHIGRRRDMSLDEEPPGRESSVSVDSQLEPSIAAAVEAGFLPKDQATVLQARLESPDRTWDEIGQGLRLSAKNCAVIHLRAILNLRVFIFIKEPGRCGGARAIADAFEAAVQRRLNPLTQHEADAFRSTVIDRTSDPFKRGILNLLRQGCTKVAYELNLP